ncbi:hypothetical protein H2200_005455 [Cladophialophora chaetospira]|uniref:Uncharacterized protein n=1 Tax=Cladophialophora chaetospira TaxID=386627 RepID=A0AA39CJX3_9EURO|nr:hypothetical protein H2200_005455 [Cladophialophora chaetospira]
MSTMPDVGALTLMPSQTDPPTNNPATDARTVETLPVEVASGPQSSLPTTKPTRKLSKFETLPVEIRLKIYEYLFVCIDFKQVSWLEDPDDAPWDKVIHRKVRPVNALAMKMVTKDIEWEVINVLKDCPIHVEVYGPHSLRGFETKELGLSRWACAQVEKVAMNMSLWDLHYITPFVDDKKFRDLRLLKLEKYAAYGPIDSNLVRAHLAQGTRNFKLDRDTTLEMIEFFELDRAIVRRIRSGRLTVQARYKFCERRHHAAGHPVDTMMAKGVLEISKEGMWVLELEAAEDMPRVQDGGKGVLKQFWENEEPRF